MFLFGWQHLWLLWFMSYVLHFVNGDCLTCVQGIVRRNLQAGNWQQGWTFGLDFFDRPQKSGFGNKNWFSDDDPWNHMAYTIQFEEKGGGLYEFESNPYSWPPNKRRSNSETEYFSYEFHHHYTNNGPRSLQIEAEGDIWIFTRASGGASNSDLILDKTNSKRGTTHTVSLQATAGSFIHVYYLHSRTGNTPYLRIQSVAITLNSCSALTSSLLASDIYNNDGSITDDNIYYSASVSLLQQDDASVPKGTIRLVKNNRIYAPSYVWFKDQRRITSGFVTEFTYLMSTSKSSGARSEGFAFVVQANEQNAKGTAGPALGYNFVNNMAIEFDTDSVGNNDPNRHHVRMQVSPLGGTNTAAHNVGKNVAEPISLPGGDSALTSGQKTVRITYLPALGNDRGKVEVYIDSLLAMSTELSSGENSMIQEMGNGKAWMGFTSGTTENTWDYDIDITNWKIWTTELSALHTDFSPTNVATQVATNTQQNIPYTDLNIRDGCNVQIDENGGPILKQGNTDISVNLELVDSGTTFTDDALYMAYETGSNGEYGIYMWYSKAVSTSFTIMLNNQPIKSNNAFVTTIQPDIIDASKCVYSPSTISGNWQVDEIKTFTIETKDRFENPQPQSSNQLSVYFSHTQDQKAPVTHLSGNEYEARLSTTVSNQETAVYLRYANVDIDNSPLRNIEILPGSVEENFCILEGDFASPEAGNEITIHAFPKDIYKNSIDINKMSSKPNAHIVMTHDWESGVTLQEPDPLWIPNPPPGYWEWKPTPKIAGTYTIQFSTDNKDWPNSTSSVRFSRAAAAQSKLEICSGCEYKTGKKSLVVMQTHDQFGNQRSTVVGNSRSFTAEVTGSNGPVDCLTEGQPDQSDPVKAECYYTRNGQYTFDFTAQTVGTYTITAKLDNQLVSTQSLDVTVGSSEVDPGESYISVASNTIIAGEVGTLTITLKDRFGNNVANPTSPASIMAIGYASIGSQGLFLLQNLDPIKISDGVYQQALVTNRTVFVDGEQMNRYRLDVKWGSTAIKDQNDNDIEIDITAASLYGPECVLQDLPTQVLTAVPWTFSLIPKDIFGNIIPSDTGESSNFQLSFLEADQVTPWGLIATPRFENGFYKFDVDNAPPEDEEIFLQVLHNSLPVSKSNNVLVPAVNDKFKIVVGRSFTSYAYIENIANFANTKAADSEHSFVIHNIKQNEDDITDPESFEVQILQSNILIPASITQIPGTARYNVLYTPLKAGVYKLNVLARCCQIENKGQTLPIDVTVIAGPFSPTRSVVEFISGTTVQAGQTFEIKVYLKDRFENALSDASGYTVEVSSSASGPKVLLSGVISVDNLDGTITATVPIEKSGEHVLEVKMKAPASTLPIPFVGDQNTLTVTPAAINPSLSEVKKHLNAEPQAGSRYQFCILAKDSYGNIVNYLPNDHFKAKFDLDEGWRDLTDIDVATDITCSSGAVYGYVASLAPGKIPEDSENDLVTLNATFMDEPLGTPATMTIKPSEMVIENSYVEGLTTNSGEPIIIKAGDKIEFSFFAKDLYGNNLRKGLSNDLSVKFGSDSRQEGAIAKPLGEYAVTITAAYTQIAKVTFITLLWQPSTLQQPITIQHSVPQHYLKVEVFAAAAEAENTNSNDWPPIEFVAGQLEQINIRLFDLYNNEVQQYSDDKVEAFFIEGTKEQESCNNGIPNMLRDVTSTRFYAASPKQEPTGNFLLNLSTTKAGGYSLFIKVNEKWTYQTSQNSLCSNAQPKIQVTPDIISPANCEITPPKKENQRAGQEAEIKITMRDQYGNLVVQNDPPPVVELKCVPSEDPNITCANIHDSLQPKCGSATFFESNADINFLGNGVHSLRFKFTKTENFTLVAVVNKKLVGDPTSCLPIPIYPYYANKFSIISQEDTTVEAGKLSSAVLLAYDEFDNEVGPSFGDTFGSNHHFILTLSREDDQNLPVLGYRFTVSSELDTPTISNKIGRNYHANLTSSGKWSGQGNRHLIYYIPEWSGRYSTTFQLISDPEYSNRNKYPVSQPSIEGSIDVMRYTCATQESGDSTPIRCGNRTCQSSYAQCGEVHECLTSPCCPPNFVACNSGGYACATDTSNCHMGPSIPSKIYCPSGVICGDGSCRANKNECPEISSCHFTTDKKCEDGTCREQKADCSSHMQCPLGWFKCSKGCVLNKDQCQKSFCPANQVRCPDGSCKNNAFLCPTVTTCNSDTPVHCADGSCVKDFALCRTQFPCKEGEEVRCPDGSCAPTATSNCATTVTCPYYTPIKCPDGSCVTKIADCHQMHSCPQHQFVCPDGSCRAALDDCPTENTCPPESPIRCVDGSCASGSLSCPDSRSIAKCSSDHVRCPDGNCARSYTACPTGRSCGSFARCLDGTCRRSVSSCPSLEQSGTTCPGQVTCPQTLQGVVCATTLEECPQEMVCPQTAPIRCPDATCALSLADCPPMPESWIDNSLASGYNFPCSEGSWVIGDASLCGPVICPRDTPVKCWDRSCRIVAEDCPPRPICDISTPYLCSSGDCVKKIELCQPPKKCQGIAQIGNAPENSTENTIAQTGEIRCSIGGCVTNRDMCKSFLNITSNEASQLREDKLECADGHRCKDGSCRGTKSECRTGRKNPSDNLDCPIYLNYRCPNGKCVLYDFECVNQQGECAQGQYQCLDGTCADIPTDPESQNPCIDGQDTQHNACPFTHPYRCSNGQCVASSRHCPVGQFTASVRRLLQQNKNNNPVRCADGSMVKSAIQCPVQACTEECLEWSNMCQDGSCISTKQSNGCSDDHIKCVDGSCKTDESQCEPLRSECFGQYLCDGTCYDFPTKPGCKLGINNCGADTPIRCADGSCKKYPAHHDYGTGAHPVFGTDTCPPVTVCTGIEPYLCEDGSCVADERLCRPVVCPPETPFLCHDHACAKTSEECLGKENCPPSLPTLCFDGSCKRSLRDCPLKIKQCSDSSKIMCFDGACVSTPLQCVARKLLSQGVVTFQPNIEQTICGEEYDICYDGSCNKPHLCPAMPSCSSGLYRCPGGSCVDESTSCENSVTVATLSGTIGDCSSGKRCADGICRVECSDFGCGVKKYFCPDSPNICSDSPCPSAETNGICFKTTCERNINAIGHSVAIPLGQDTMVDVSLDNNRNPRTRLLIPSGAFGKSTSFSISPVPHSDVYHSADQTSRVLSTPFSCSVDSDTFDLDVIVYAAVTQKREDYGSGSSVNLNAPCELIANYSLEVDVKAEQVLVACRLKLQLDGTQYHLQWDVYASVCRDAFPEMLGKLTSIDDQAHMTEWKINDRKDWDGANQESKHCLCFTMENDDLLCSSFSRIGNDFHSYHYTDKGKWNQCPRILDYEPIVSPVSQRKLIRKVESVDACQKDSRAITPIDTCLASTPLGNGKPNWKCLASSQDRVGKWMPWTSHMGLPRNRVRGRIQECGEYAYAFIFTPLPVGQYGRIEVPTLWEQNASLFTGLIVGTILFLIISGCILWRLARYRPKYKAERKRLDDLMDKKHQLDEYHGGLGVGDEDIAMQPNPLVIQQRSKEEQLKVVQDKLNVSEENDKKIIDALEKERQKLMQDIDRIQSRLNEQQQAPQRIVDSAPSTQAASIELNAPTTQAATTQPKKDFGGGKPKSTRFGGGKKPKKKNIV